MGMTATSAAIIPKMAENARIMNTDASPGGPPGAGSVQMGQQFHAQTGLPTEKSVAGTVVATNVWD